MNATEFDYRGFSQEASMERLPGQLEVSGMPRHVESWSVARIPGFVVAVLRRWQRNYGELPQRFVMVMCPQVEINALGGLPDRVSALTDPKLTCRHFTGCHKPYFVVIFTGENAAQRRAEIQELLPWSEGYEVEITEDAIHLCFAEATEELGEPATGATPVRTVQELLESGELVSILA
jgi:hypothetical protein